MENQQKWEKLPVKIRESLLEIGNSHVISPALASIVATVFKKIYNLDKKSLLQSMLVEGHN